MANDSCERDRVVAPSMSEVHLLAGEGARGPGVVRGGYTPRGDSLMQAEVGPCLSSETTPVASITVKNGQVAVVSKD